MMMWLMFLPVLITMDKRVRYVISSVVSAIGFWSFLTLPYESRYFGLLAGVVLMVFCFWFGLGIIFTTDFFNRMMTAMLPVLFFISFGMFAVLLPNSWWLTLLVSLFFGVIVYVMFLVENVFWVAIGFRTVPLYRAAYTVGLIIMIMTAFMAFNSLYSFKMSPWLNFVAVGVIGIWLFLYHFWSVAIELADDGKKQRRWAYALISGLSLAEIALVLSFWPIGIFKTSVYLVSMVYVLAGLIQAAIRDRLFKRIWLQYVWIAVAIVLAVVVTTSWK